MKFIIVQGGGEGLQNKSKFWHIKVRASIN